jgi:hypothetical protein
LVPIADVVVAVTFGASSDLHTVRMRLMTLLFRLVLLMAVTVRFTFLCCLRNCAVTKVSGGDGQAAFAVAHGFQISDTP